METMFQAWAECKDYPTMGLYGMKMVGFFKDAEDAWYYADRAAVPGGEIAVTKVSIKAGRASE